MQFSFILSIRPLELLKLEKVKGNKISRKILGLPLPTTIFMKVFWFYKLNLQFFFVFVFAHISLLADLRQSFCCIILYTFLENCFDTVAVVPAQAVFKIQAASVFYRNATNF